MLWYGCRGMQLLCIGILYPSYLQTTFQWLDHTATFINLVLALIDQMLSQHWLGLLQDNLFDGFPVLFKVKGSPKQIWGLWSLLTAVKLLSMVEDVSEETNQFY